MVAHAPADREEQREVASGGRATTRGGELVARWHVHVVQMRARDVRRGDVVARDAANQGWFRVHEATVLPDGSVNVTDKSNQRSFTAGPYDLIALQTPVPLPAEADASNRRRRASPSDDGVTGADDDAAAAREAIARELHQDPNQARGTLPSS
jgi:hypothetical protein